MVMRALGLGTRHGARSTRHSKVQVHDGSALLLVSAYGQSRWIHSSHTTYQGWPLLGDLLARSVGSRPDRHYQYPFINYCIFCL